MDEHDEQQRVDIDQTFHSQRSYALKLRSTDCRQRLEVLARFEKVFKASYAKMYSAAAADFSKPEVEVDATEILPVVVELKQVRRQLRRWMKPKKVLPTMMVLGTSSEIVSEPRGVCLIVSPWNYPFNLTFGPMILAIAAGNTVIIKPSEMTPYMSAVIADIVEQTFRSEEVAVFQGPADTSSYLTSLPFDHIFFTGSPRVGRHVMAAAAQNLTSVTLELGGKSPVIVDAKAPLKKAADAIVFGKFCNNGQTCIAPDYLYVEATVKQAFIAELKVSIAKQYGSIDDLASNTDYCRIVNDAHFTRLEGLLDDALEKGAEILAGGTRVREERLIEPTLLEGMDDSAAIMQEEIFGPLLPIIEYSDLDEVIGEINRRPKPLALYIFSRDRAMQDKVIQQTSAGDTCINQIALHFMHPNLPFGGVNNSGLGKTGGQWGFDAFSHQRSVLTDNFSCTAMIQPPYTSRVRGMIKTAVKFFS